SRTNSCSGRARASGIPGAPPPEPTSTTGPSHAPTSSAARKESSSSTRRAASRSRAVSPGVATTARSQSSSELDDDVAIGLLAFAHRAHALVVLQPLVDEPALRGAHRLELDARALAQRLLGAADGDGFERPAAAVAVAGGVDHDVHPVGKPAARDRPGEHLHRVDRGTVLADQESELG